MVPRIVKNYLSVPINYLCPMLVQYGAVQCSIVVQECAYMVHYSTTLVHELPHNGAGLCKLWYKRDTGEGATQHRLRRRTPTATKKRG